LRSGAEGSPVSARTHVAGIDPCRDSGADNLGIVFDDL
jgi:hypothetical protein